MERHLPATSFKLTRKDRELSADMFALLFEASDLDG